MTVPKNLYLDLYSAGDTGKSELIHHRLTGIDAYDGWHCLMYMKEIILARELLSCSTFRFEDIPRKEKNVLLFLILKVFPGLKNITELGSSVGELIDGLELMNKYFLSAGFGGLESEVFSYKFLGIERSELLRQVAVQLHHGYQMTLVDSCSSVTDVGGILYDRSVSSYAFATVKGLAGFLKKFDVALLNLFLSKDETFISTASGGAFTYFSMKELVSCLEQPLFHLFGYKSPVDRSMGRSVIEGFFFYGSREMAEKFIKESQDAPEIKGYFLHKEIFLKDVRTLF